MGLVARVCSWTWRLVRGVRAPEGRSRGLGLMGRRPAQVKVARRVEFCRAASRAAREAGSVVGGAGDGDGEAAAMAVWGCAGYGVGRVELRGVESCSAEGSSVEHSKYICMVPFVNIYTLKTTQTP